MILEVVFQCINYYFNVLPPASLNYVPFNVMSMVVMEKSDICILPLKYVWYSLWINNMDFENK